MSAPGLRRGADHCHLPGAPGLLDPLAIAFVSSRVPYWLCDLAGWAPVRWLAWFVGMGLLIGLLLVAA